MHYCNMHNHTVGHNRYRIARCIDIQQDIIHKTPHKPFYDNTYDILHNVFFIFLNDSFCVTCCAVKLSPDALISPQIFELVNLVEHFFICWYCMLSCHQSSRYSARDLFLTLIYYNTQQMLHTFGVFVYQYFVFCLMWIIDIMSSNFNYWSIFEMPTLPQYCITNYTLCPA